VLARGDRKGDRRPLYNGATARRLCWWFGELTVRLIFTLIRHFCPGLTTAAVLVGSLGVGGCSYRLSSLTSKDDGDTSTTGSIGPAGSPSAQADAGSPNAQVDLTYARVAISDAMARGAKDSSLPWQNPETGAGGNITPLDTAYTEDGLPCRDFLASYVHGGSQDWLQGAACRTPHGVWEVKRLKSLKPS